LLAASGCSPPARQGRPAVWLAMSSRYHDGQGPAGAKRRRQRGGKERQARRQGSDGLEVSWDAVKSSGEQAQGKGGRTPCGRRVATAATAKASQEPKAKELKPAPLPDLTERLVKCGAFEEYQRWREAYRRWREGEARGAEGEAGVKRVGDSATTEGPIRLSQTWRDAYRSWRKGGLRGARGEMEAHGQHADEARSPQVSGSIVVPPVVHDVVMGPSGEPAFLPSDGPSTAPIPLQDFPKEAMLTIRVFRFFEDRADEVCDWEKSLLNVNSGSIFWLPWQLKPNLHSKAGAKYGTWFTIHYVQVYAKHFQSQYHMCNEGVSSGAKTFGSSSASTKAVTGQAMPEGYFWYVSPASSSTIQEQPQRMGWQHLDRAGPFDGELFLRTWQERGSPMEVRVLQEIVAKMVSDSTKKKL